MFNTFSMSLKSFRNKRCKQNDVFLPHYLHFIPPAFHKHQKGIVGAEKKPKTCEGVGGYINTEKSDGWPTSQ